MLHDSQTDMVFISRALDINHHRLYESLTDAFYEANVRYDVMPTQEFLCSVGIFESSVGILERRQNLKKIIWLRDYMPVTVDKHGGVEQFLCDSSPNMLLVCNQFGITPFQNDIKLVFVTADDLQSVAREDDVVAIRNVQTEVGTQYAAHMDTVFAAQIQLFQCAAHPL